MALPLGCGLAAVRVCACVCLSGAPGALPSADVDPAGAVRLAFETAGSCQAGFCDRGLAMGTPKARKVYEPEWVVLFTYPR